MYAGGAWLSHTHSHAATTAAAAAQTTKQMESVRLQNSHTVLQTRSLKSNMKQEFKKKKMEKT
ncbi:hypothetical protein GCM10010106_50990 [Thermopolyspora flexuosa]|nr:hypothetical protein GCM10010106_50990 [Thermopolyspora flexuosa]